MKDQTRVDRPANMQLSPADFQILVGLGREDRHGYGIMQRVESLTGEKLLPATLYTRLSRLLDQGMVEEIPAPTDADARRRYYRLTEAGLGAAQAEARRLARLLSLAADEAMLEPTP